MTKIVLLEESEAGRQSIIHLSLIQAKLSDKCGVNCSFHHLIELSVIGS